MQNKRPKQITQTLYFVQWTGSSDVELAVSDSTVEGLRVVLGSTEVTVDVPDDLRDPVEAQIESLTDERKRLQAETQAKIQNIDEQIKRLQAIEYKPE